MGSLISDTKGDTDAEDRRGRGPREDGGRDWSDAPTYEPRRARGCRQPSGARRQGHRFPQSFQKDPVNTWILDFGFLASRTVSKSISVVLSHERKENFCISFAQASSHAPGGVALLAQWLRTKVLPPPQTPFFVSNPTECCQSLLETYLEADHFSPPLC